MPRYSGKWNLTEQMQAIAASTWTGLPLTQLYTINVNAGDSGQTTPDTTLRLTQQDKAYARLWIRNASDMLGVTEDGELFGWGGNGGYINNTAVATNSPVQVTSGSGVFPAAGVQGPSNTSGFAAPDSDGRLWVTGVNNYGMLAIGNQINKSSPVQVGSLTNWAKAGYGGSDNNSSFIKTDGTLWTAGDATAGRLGDNQRTVHRSSPVQIGSGTDWANLNQMTRHSTAPGFAIKTNGTLWYWGSAYYGAGGNDQGFNVFRSSPVQVGSDSDWAEVYASGPSVLALKTNGTLWAWGQNDRGELGLNVSVAVSSPTQVGALTNWAGAFMGSTTAYAWKTNGELYGMGRGNYGEFGDGTTTPNRSSPVQVAADTLTDVQWAATSRGGLIVNVGST